MFFRALIDILFPPLCHICKTFIPDAGDIHLCAGCREKLIPLNSPLCLVCGVPFATENGIDHLCGPCLSHPPAYAAARAALVFSGPVQDLVHRFKYGHKVHLCRPLGLLTAGHLAGFAAHVAADLVIPVPLHKKRLRWRGYNQAVLLGGILAKQWRLPLLRHNLRRVRWTEPQVNLAATERAENVRGAFAVTDKDAVAGKRVILVDDVYTTGSTVAECAKTLKCAGAEAVFVVTAARVA
ncbi:ComF family protein [Geotalea uraniireducens]|uniref:Amidophosphoribosyltransferase-like protein n=1 Tax=Geotalea uraniireducens (strain Rf4) TaxID=351605 RepID=A5G900_GEOUR|nr:ComF family protein [Geotalea uraniireducens]ABQ28268.1 amidophosphoribosyltransferase-like protein [Geotalea uraniireducens Rf4]